ncbi:hypothetical protein CLU79DRAFT_217957 [Phycomyces nitens]|nr:hypothetical protein CLU79DRAFT_217957 [Phycomyces nitens]
MLAQDVGHQQHHNQNNNSQQQNSQQENRPSPARVRQRTMSQTVTGSLPGLPKDQKHQRPSTVRKTDGQRSIRRIVSLASHRSVIAPEVFEPDPRPTQRKPLDSASEEDSDEQLSKDPPVRKMSPDLRRVPKTDKDDTPKYTLKDTPVRLNNTEPSTDDAPIIRRSSKASDDYGYKERLQQRARTLRPAASLATLRQLAQPMGEELPTRPATSFRRSFSQDEEAASWRLHHPHSPPHSPRTSGARPLVRSDTAHSMRTLTRRANAREDLQGWSANNLNNRATDQNDTDAPLDSSMNSEASWWSGQPSDEDEHRPDTDASSDSSENSPCSRRHIDTVDQLRAALDQDKAVIKALQGQKEACNRDIAFLSQNIDLLSTEAADWKKKWETEKLQKEQCKEELASVVRKLAETSDKVRHLTGTNEDLKRDLEKCRQQDTKEEPRDQCADDNSTKMDQLKAQLELSQDQVRVLKATMEQFLRMGIFSSDLAQGSGERITICSTQTASGRT